MAPAFETLIIFSVSVGRQCVINGFKHLLLFALRGKEGRKLILSKKRASTLKGKKIKV